MAKDLDLTKSLEAVHKSTGEVVPVTFDRKAYDGEGFYTKECPDSATTNHNWYSDGRDYCGLNQWYVRNVTTDAELAKQLRDATKAVREAAKELYNRGYKTEGYPVGSYIIDVEVTKISKEIKTKVEL